MQTGTPSLLYWQPGTIEVLQAVRRWRGEDGLASYFTIDAGPNVHVLCLAEDVPTVHTRLSALSSVTEVLVSRPGPPPFALTDHLF
jgi:diphosphomevalonate decarboxylase